VVHVISLVHKNFLKDRPSRAWRTGPIEADTGRRPSSWSREMAHGISVAELS